MVKAVVASLATAAVLVGGAWASNVTPVQVSKLNARVNALSTQVVELQKVTKCLQDRFNATTEQPFLVSTWGGFDTKDGNLDLLIAPNAANGLVGTGYLLEQDTITPAC